jgi:hypothetical protein
MRSITLLGAAALLGAACGGGEPPGDSERFCGEVQANSAALTTAPATEDEIDGFLDEYRRIGELAPLAIEPHWQALVLNYETASTVEPEDPESVQRAVGRAYATERSAVAVKTWLLANCNVDIGPVSTIVPPAPPPPPTTVVTG